MASTSDHLTLKAEAAELGYRQAQHRQALALFPLLRAATKKALSAEAHTQNLALSLLAGTEAMLQRSIDAVDLPAFAEASNATVDLLTEVTVQWERVGQADADVLWGLRAGILSSIAPHDEPAPSGGLASKTPVDPQVLQLRERALQIINELGEETSRVYAVASAGRAFVGEDAVTEQHLFEVIQGLVERTSLQQTLEGMVKEMASLAEIRHG